MLEGLDLVYWVFGVGALSVALNMILESLEKENYKVMINISAFLLIMFRVFGAASELFSFIEATFIR